MLTVLKLHSCEGITSASMAAIAHSYMLEVCLFPHPFHTGSRAVTRSPYIHIEQ